MIKSICGNINQTTIHIRWDFNIGVRKTLFLRFVTLLRDVKNFGRQRSLPQWVGCNYHRWKYFIRRDKVTILFRGFPAKTNEVLRQSGKSSAQTAFVRLSSTWIRVVGLKLRKKQRRPARTAKLARLNVSRTNDSPMHSDWFRYFVSTVTKYLLCFRFRFAALVKRFRVPALRAMNSRTDFFLSFLKFFLLAILLSSWRESSLKKIVCTIWFI